MLKRFRRKLDDFKFRMRIKMLNALLEHPIRKIRIKAEHGNGYYTILLDAAGEYEFLVETPKGQRTLL